MHRIVIDTSLALNDNKYQINLQNIFPCTEESEENVRATPSEELLIHHEPRSTVVSARISKWEYLQEEEVEKILQMKKKNQIRQFIESKTRKKPKGLPRVLFRELMYSVTKFCKKSNFNVDQTGAILSQFYLTHLYFTSSLDVGAEKVYKYFEDFQYCHSLPFPPHSLKLFNLEETKTVMTYFCKLYLRHLPIIRFLCIPNFTLKAHYYIPPELNLKKKGKKGGKDGKKKGKKKKK